jgi:hypothetical protein
MDETKCILLGFGSSALDPSTLSISQELTSTLHPSEVQLLRSLLPLGAHYWRIRQFCTAVTVGRIDGLYAASLSAGSKEVLATYEAAVQGAASIAGLNDIRKNFGPSLEALAAMSTGDNKTTVLIDQIQQFVTNQELPHRFRAFVGTSAIMGLLFVIAHYVAHGVILHNCPDFFIKQEAVGDREELVVNAPLLCFGISEELAVSILISGRERHTLLRESKLTGGSWASKGVDPAASAIFNSIHNPSLCSGGVLAVDELETRIEAAKGLWSRALWSAVGLSSSVHVHLASIRDMFLCHRGDLWQTFVERCFPGLVSSASTGHVPHPRPIAECFRTAVAMTTRDVDGVVSAFAVGVDGAAAAGSVVTFQQPQSRNPVARFGDVAQRILAQIAALRLLYNSPTGIHLVVSRSALGIYQSVFSFNMRMRFSFFALLQTRLLLRDAVKRIALDRQSSATSATAALVHRTLALLQTLMFVQSNLGYYLQVDVIEKHYAQLQQGFESVSNVERAKQLHDRFVLAVAEGSFYPNEVSAQHSNTILESVEMLFVSSLTLYVLCANKPSPTEREAGTHTHALMMLESKVNKELMPVLVGSLSISTKTSERALWSRIDFNRYFSRGGGGSGGPSGGVSSAPTGMPVSLSTFQPISIKPQTASLKLQQLHQSER